MDPMVALAHSRVAHALEGLEELFVDGMLLSFIARHPTNPDAHMVVTADTFGGIRQALRETAASRGEEEE